MFDDTTRATPTGQPICITASGATLSGMLYSPTSVPVAVIVLNGATGVPQRYYRNFARWLAEARNMACLTYDYRDFGASAQAHPRQSSATMQDWGMLDQVAARNEMRRRYPGVPLRVVGHSLGGMMAPLQDDHHDIEQVICVGSGLVWHRDHPWPYQALARAFWFGHVPALVRALGYLPGRFAGFGPDLPASVYWQWRQWCTSRRFFFPHLGTTLPAPQWQGATTRVSLLAMTDDPICTMPAMYRLRGLYGAARTSIKTIDPRDHGLAKVGHLGAFARANAALWPKLIEG
ncbi:alpha/beta hydrolase family protein [Arenibacterium halophilum]|uniref:Alpha/beta fold hydrolase n=1 Tax=Arenibacterium halophilum TaxID=2583821 RepID=A0ABY2X8L8_9RHOB|nr:alpha/beta fold hydrolase [Arenibacterium halophilum]TMV11786.1 alpha/beta fold hydrolase [Arenibacterium halophilum]